MKLQQLKYIVEIADCGSITKASRKLFVSQPYLSKVVSEFETKMGKQIFIRNSSGLELTTYGHKVYLLIQSVLNQLELLQNLDKTEFLEEEEANLSFSVANLILKDSLLLDYISTGSAARNRINFCETTIDGCIENIENETSEFAIIVIDDYQKTLLLNLAVRKELEYVELDEGYLYYHFHRVHPLAGLEKVSIDSLMHYPFVRLKTDRFSAFSSQKFQKEYSYIHVPRSIVVNNYHSYLNFVKNNGAFMIGNKWQISELEKMGIKSIRFSSLKHKVHLGVLKKEISPLSDETKKFLDLFKESYGLNRV